MERSTNVIRVLVIALMCLCGLSAFAQKFYYDGGYFEKVGNKWFEYKPSQKEGVWNRFDQTDEPKAGFFVIDNGACKVAVPKSPDKDFYILLKGSNDWQWKYKSIPAPATEGVSSRGPRTARDRRAFHRAYFNEGGVCILAAYCLLLDYANSTDNTIPDFDSYDVMSEYLRFQNTLEPTRQLTAPYIRANHRDGEKVVSKAINGYCMARGWSGLIQVGNFHRWLSGQKPWAEHVEIVERGLDRVGKLNNTREPLPYAYSTLSNTLKQNADENQEYDYAALLLYYVESASSYHAIFLGYDKDGFFMRGPNYYDKFVDTTCDFDFRFTPDAPIVEYIIMRIKRPEKGKDTARWKGYNASTFRTKTTGASQNELVNPIPIKSMRVDPKNCKTNPHVAALLTMRSKSNPDFEVVFHYGIEEKGIKVNGQLGWGGRVTPDGLIEYDLRQICPDLEIVSYGNGFNFNNFSYQ